MNSAEAGAQLLARGPVDLGVDMDTLAGSDAGWEYLFEIMRWPMEEDLLAPIAAAAAAADAAEYSGPTRARGKKRVSVYGPPTDEQVEPDRYVPRPTKSREGKNVYPNPWVPEAQRKRICIDLSVQLTDEEEVEAEDPRSGNSWRWHKGHVWSVTHGLYMPKWPWDANYVVKPNNGWAEVVEVY